MLAHISVSAKESLLHFRCPPGKPEANDARMGRARSFGRNAEIYGEGESSGNVYKVLSGMVRVYKLLQDGHRQISDFHMAGDMFGFELDQERHFSAEAVVPTKLLCIKWDGAGEIRSGAYLRQLLELVKELRQSQERLLLLGRKNALERLVYFLLEMAQRSGNSRTIELAMPRHDIADYLGVTLETVSRSFAELKALGVIKLDGARRVLFDRNELAEIQ